MAVLSETTMKKILIIDDNDLNRELFVLSLKGKALCDESSSGHDGVEKFTKAYATQAPYDLVILDIRMPDINGLTVLFEMRQLEKQAGLIDRKPTPIIVVTAYTILSTEAFRLGCTDYLTKPVLPEKLVEVIEKNIGSLTA